MKTKTVFFFFFFLILIFGFSYETFASGPIKVSPFRIERAVDPGERVTSFVTVTNDSDEPKTFYLFVRDFIPKGERGEVRLIPVGSQEGPFLSGWVETYPQGINFAPKEKREIAVNFRVPENVGPGGYYGAVVFGPKAPEPRPGEGNLILFTHQVGVLVLFQVRGEVNEEARIREFTTDSDFYGAPFEVNFKIRVENLGNVHLKPTGTIIIENMRGTEVASLPINTAGANALPKSIRRFDSKWEGDFGFGKYTANLVLSFGSLTVGSGTGIRTVAAQKTFWIIPWDIIIPFGIILLVVIFIAFFIAKWYKEKAIKEAFQEAGLGRRLSYLKNRKVNIGQIRLGEEKRKKAKRNINPILIFIIVIISISLSLGLTYFLFLA